VFNTICVSEHKRNRTMGHGTSLSVCVWSMVCRICWMFSMNESRLSRAACSLCLRLSSIVALGLFFCLSHSTAFCLNLFRGALASVPPASPNVANTTYRSMSLVSCASCFSREASVSLSCIIPLSAWLSTTLFSPALASLAACGRQRGRPPWLTPARFDHALDPLQKERKRTFSPLDVSKTAALPVLIR